MFASETVKNFYALKPCTQRRSYPTMMQPNYDLKTKKLQGLRKAAKTEFSKVHPFKNVHQSAFSLTCSLHWDSENFKNIRLKAFVFECCVPCRVVCHLVPTHSCKFSKAPKSDSVWRFSSSPLPAVLQTSLWRTKKSFNSAGFGLGGFNMRAGLLSLQHFSAFFVCWFRFMHIFIASASEHEKINLVCALNLNAKPNIALHSSLSCKCKSVHGFFCRRWRRKQKRLVH